MINLPGVHLNISPIGIIVTIGQRKDQSDLGDVLSNSESGIPGSGIFEESQLNLELGQEEPQYLNIHQSEIPKIDVGEDSTKHTIESIEGVISEAMALHNLFSEKIINVENELKKLRHPQNLFKRIVKNWYAKQFMEKEKIYLDELVEHQENLAQCKVRLFIYLGDEIAEKFNNLENQHLLLLSNPKKWSINAQILPLSITNQSGPAIDKESLVVMSFENHPVIESRYNPLKIQSPHKTNLYFYPGFGIITEGENIKLFSLQDLKVVFTTYHQQVSYTLLEISIENLFNLNFSFGHASSGKSYKQSWGNYLDLLNIYTSGNSVAKASD